MPLRQYRLAAPIDNNEVIETKILVLYRPALSRSPLTRSRLVTSNDADAGTRTVLLDNANGVGKAAPVILPARWWLVLPPVALIMFITASNPLLMIDLLKHRYEQRYGSHESKEKEDVGCRQSTSTPMPRHYWPFPPRLQQSSQDHSDYDHVQNAVSKFHIQNSLVTLFPALVIFIVLGSNCDTVGRRPLLFLPFVGKIIHNILLLIIISHNLSDAWLLISHALDSMLGSHGLVILGALAYISDCTLESDRTRAFFFLEVTMVVMRVAPMLALGLWLRHHRYLYSAPISVFLALSVIGALYVMFIQPESVENVRKVSLVRQLSRVRLKPIKRIVQVFAAKRPGNNRQIIVLITIVIILLLFVHFGYYSTYILYLYGRPFCMNALTVSLLASAQALFILLLTVLAVHFKEQMDSTYLPPIIGTFALIVDLVVFGLAKVVWLLYIAVCIGSLYFVTQPVLRSKLTKLVKKNEYAVIFIGAGIIESIGHQAVGVVANSIYKVSLHFFPGLVFLVFALLGFVAIIIMSYLFFIDRKECNKNGGKANAKSNDDSKASVTSNNNGKM